MRYLKRKRVENAGHPKGFWGRWTMRAMNKDHDALTDWGLSYLTVNGEEKILDVGCGGGKTVKKLAQATCNTVWGADISATAVNEAFHTNKKAVKSGHVMICKAGVFSLPFDNDTFDIITAVETVYFWPDLLQCFREVWRVLKPGGIFFICNESNGDTDKDEKWTKIINGMTIYQDIELKAYLEQAGFHEVQIHKNKAGWLCVTARK